MFLIVQNACFCKIEIQTLILLTSTKLATKRFIKLFVDVNKSISEQTIYFATDIDVGWLDVFLIQSKQKTASLSLR